MPPNNLFQTFRSFTCSGDTFSQETSDLIVETPLEIIINREKHIFIMFTPQMIRELVVGYIFTEGFISDASEIDECIISPVQKKEAGMELICIAITILFTNV